MSRPRCDIEYRRGNGDRSSRLRGTTPSPEASPLREGTMSSTSLAGESHVADAQVRSGPAGVSRRRFIGYVVAGPTVISGAQLWITSARAAVPTHQPVDRYDL